MKIKFIKKIKKEKLAGEFFHAYIRLVAATGQIEVRNTERIKNNRMLGYWHGDSYCMQLVLRKIASETEKKKGQIQVIVTADKRGDAIEKMINHYGAKAIRLPDGLNMRPFFKELKAISLSEETILGTAFDGPVGPLYEPKKLLFLLAYEADKEMSYVHFTYKRVLRLKHRWDNYVIPLPFSKITASIEDLGKITRQDLTDFKEYQKKLIY